MSATPPDEVRAGSGAAAAVAAGFVKKPFHLDDLSRVVDEALAAGAPSHSPLREGVGPTLRQAGALLAHRLTPAQPK